MILLKNTPGQDDFCMVLSGGIVCLRRKTFQAEL